MIMKRNNSKNVLTFALNSPQTFSHPSTRQGYSNFMVDLDWFSNTNNYEMRSSNILYHFNIRSNHKHIFHCIVSIMMTRLKLKGILNPRSINIQLVWLSYLFIYTYMWGKINNSILLKVELVDRLITMFCTWVYNDWNTGMKWRRLNKFVANFIFHRVLTPWSSRLRRFNTRIQWSNRVRAHASKHVDDARAHNTLRSAQRTNFD